MARHCANGELIATGGEAEPAGHQASTRIAQYIMAAKRLGPERYEAGGKDPVQCEVCSEAGEGAGRLVQRSQSAATSSNDKWVMFMASAKLPPDVSTAIAVCSRGSTRDDGVDSNCIIYSAQMNARAGVLLHVPPHVMPRGWPANG